MTPNATMLKKSIPLLPTIATLCLLAILFYLGCWQINRGTIKKNYRIEMEKTSNLPARSFNQVKNLPYSEIKFKEVSLDVNFTGHKIFLDNYTQNKQIGFRLIAPAKINAGRKLVLIDLGFIPALNMKRELPDFQLPNKLHIQGKIYKVATGITLSNNIIETNDKLNYRLQTMEYGLLATSLGQDFYNYLIIPNNSISPTLSKIPIEFGISPQKHYGYAFQWFSIAACLMVYYLITVLRKRSCNAK